MIKNAFAYITRKSLKSIIIMLVILAMSTLSLISLSIKDATDRNSSKEINVSSLISFEAYCNDYSTSVSLSALSAFSDKNQLDGTVAPGKKMNGIVAYEVPADWSKLEIEYSPSFWGKAMKFVAEHN